jgi:hypothetical protein
MLIYVRIYKAQLMSQVQNISDKNTLIVPISTCNNTFQRTMGVM